MEKRKPHYNLADVKLVVSDPDARPFTATALRGGLELGLSEHEMRQVVLSLQRKDFYKSMTTYFDKTGWQDVYHGVTPYGERVYIKIGSYADERPPVIQFKKK